MYWLRFTQIRNQLSSQLRQLSDKLQIYVANKLKINSLSSSTFSLVNHILGNSNRWENAINKCEANQVEVCREVKSLQICAATNAIFTAHNYFVCVSQIYINKQIYLYMHIYTYVHIYIYINICMHLVFSVDFSLVSQLQAATKLQLTPFATAAVAVAVAVARVSKTTHT